MARVAIINYVNEAPPSQSNCGLMEQVPSPGQPRIHEYVGMWTLTMVTTVPMVTAVLYPWSPGAWSNSNTHGAITVTTVIITIPNSASVDTTELL